MTFVRRRRICPSGSSRLYIYIQKARHFSKSKTICVTFLFTKIQTLCVMRFFMKYLKLEFIYIQKAWHFALRDVFIYQNPDTSKKSKTICVMFFYIKKAWYFALHDFSWYFWNWRRVRVIFIITINALCVKFVYVEKNEISVTFSYTKSQTFCVTLLWAKQIHFALRFYI